MNRLLTAALLLLAACTDPLQWTTQWTRPGAPTTALNADLAECRAEAATATDREQRIDADIAATRDPARNDPVEPFRSEMRRFDTTRLYHETVERCMRARGYAPAGAGI